MKNKLKIRGARQHNLKDVNVDIEKNKLVESEMISEVSNEKAASYIKLL